MSINQSIVRMRFILIEAFLIFIPYMAERENFLMVLTASAKYEG